MGLADRFKRAVNVFAREPTQRDYYDTGPGYSYRPDRVRFSRGNERSIVTSVYNRIALKHPAQFGCKRMLQPNCAGCFSY